MKAAGIAVCALVSLAVAGVVSPSAVLADNPSLVTDVAMTADGRLVGQVVDGDGVPVADTAVSVRSQDREWVRAVTDKNGFFAVKGLPGGIYQFVAADGFGSYRVWTPELAPPGARQGALIVAGQQLVRGQMRGMFPGGLQGIVSNPWFMAATVAASVAAPVAVHNSEREDNGPISP